MFILIHSFAQNQFNQVNVLHKKDSIGHSIHAHLDDFDFIEDSYRFHLQTDQNSSHHSKGYSGRFTSYYSDLYEGYGKDLKYAEGQFINGKKEGKWNYYFCDGTKKHETYFTNGQKDGKWINYDHCNQSNLFTNAKDQTGYFGMLTMITDYFALGYFPFNFEKEIIFYENDIPSDTIYYFDHENHLELKLSIRDESLFYDNDQPFLNKKLIHIYDFKESAESGNVEGYFRSGKLMYSLKKSDNMLIEKHYYENGAKHIQGIYFNEAGRVTFYDINGKITEENDQNFQEGKYGWECNCQ